MKHAQRNRNKRVEIKMISANGEIMKRFPSIKKAAEDLGVSRQAIRNCLAGSQKTVQGHKIQKKEPRRAKLLTLKGYNK